MPLYFLYPLAAGFIYSIATLMLKRASQNGVGPWRIVFVVNTVLLLTFVPVALQSGMPWDNIPLWYPVIAGLSFFLGQVFTFWAMTRGDLSIATPVLGTKVLLVATFTTLILHQPVPLSWWIAAILTTVAVWLMRGHNPHVRRLAIPTVISSFLAAVCFAFTDVLVQKWAPVYGFNRFMPIGFLACFAASFSLIPFFNGNLFSMPSRTWRWLLPGAFLLSIQAMLVAYAIGRYGHATALNVVYSSRGLWSIALIWFAGSWFNNAEREAGPRVMRDRLIGSLLIVAAIILVSD